MSNNATNVLPVIDYSRRDFQSIKEELLNFLKQKFPNTWKDFYESQMGMAWLELVAFCFDCLSFALDYHANESFLPTAQDRENIVKLCRLVGYKLRSASAASVQVLLTLNSAQVDDVIIPVGTKVVSSTNVPFEFLLEGRIPAGSLTSEVVITQGETKEESFNSDGSPFQSFTLTDRPVIDGSVIVKVNGEEWKEVESVVYGDSASLVYSVDYDVDENDVDIAIINFGDGISGAIPPAGSTIEVTYRIGGGISGNVPLNTIEYTVSGYIEGSSPPQKVGVIVTNPSYRGTGGDERESIQHAKYWAPLFVRTNGRAVTERDFDTLASIFRHPTYGSVAYAKAKLRQEIPELNTVDIYCWSRDSQGNPQPISESLKNALSEYFNNNGAGSVRLICTKVEIQDGINLYLDINVRVAPVSNYTSSSVISNVRTAIKDLFDNPNNQPGTAFRLSEMYHAVQSTPGVDYLLITEITAGIKYIESIGTGDGIKKEFSGTLSKIPVIPLTVVVTADDMVLTDDGEGNLQGDGSGSIDYSTGEISVTFKNAVSASADVVVTYRQLQKYYRNGIEKYGDGVTARFRGNVKYCPVVPGSFALAAGSIVAKDDGKGNLVGNVNSSGKNIIDYDTGFFDVTFSSVPVNQQKIYSSYYQYLKVSSGDIPVDKSQLAVLGNLTINIIEE